MTRGVNIKVNMWDTKVGSRIDLPYYTSSIIGEYVIVFMILIFTYINDVSKNEVLNTSLSQSIFTGWRDEMMLLFEVYCLDTFLKV